MIRMSKPRRGVISLASLAIAFLVIAAVLRVRGLTRGSRVAGIA